MSVPRNIVDIVGIQDDLSNWGYAIVQDATTLTEISEGRRQFLQYLRNLPRKPGCEIQLTSITDHLSKPRVKELSRIWPLHRGFGAPTELDIFHLPISWKLRQKPALYELYSQLLGTTKLLANLDRVCLKLPGSGETEFIHIDRDPTHYDPEAGLQSMIFFNDSRFYAIPKSHTPEFHKAVSTVYQIPRKDKERSMTMIDQSIDADRLHLESHLETINVPTGSLLIWSENLWHASKPNTSDQIRLALYFGYHRVEESPNSIEERLGSYYSGRLPTRFPSGCKTHLVPARYQNFTKLINPYLAILPEEYHGTRTVRSTGKQVPWLDEDKYDPVTVCGYLPPVLTTLGQRLLGKIEW